VLARLQAEAARQGPDLAAAQAQRDAAEANITVAKAAGLPSISIGANYQSTIAPTAATSRMRNSVRTIAESA